MAGVTDVRGRGVGVVAILVVIVSQVHTIFTCPKDCFCPPHSKNVQCANKGFPIIPDTIPLETLELNLNENTFKNAVLSRRNFTDLLNLENLYLSDCGIETIAVDTFADLQHLIWLDISKNNIRFIADFTFRGLHLKHLFINDNTGLELARGAFAGMTTQGLYMHNCGLRRLNVDRMSPLNGSLKTLWLHGNRFQAFNEKWIYFFKKLAHVRLGGNEFHCNCEIQWLYTFFKENRNSLFFGGDQPRCETPSLVKGKDFEELSKENFRCEMPTFQNVDAVFDNKVNNVVTLTCLARGDPAPTVHWVQPDGNIETTYPKEDDTSENEGILYMTGLTMDTKEMYRCVASNPAGNVTFSLNVVWPNLKPTQPPTPKPTKPDNRNVIRDGDTGITETNPKYKNYAGDDSGVYGFAGINSESKMKSSKSLPGISSDRRGEAEFSFVDLVGAVVGTFLLTLLISVTVFHFYYKRRERLRQEDHYSVPDEVNNKRGPNSVYVMNEPEENRIKMINHNTPMECPS